MEIMSAREAADKWGISQRRVAVLCAENRIANAESVVLESYDLKAVTEGADALGEVKVKITSNNGSFTGRGVSTDVIKASIKAYVNAINKWTRAKG